LRFLRGPSRTFSGTNAMRTYISLVALLVLVLAGCDSTARTSKNSSTGPTAAPVPSTSSTAVPSTAGTYGAPAVNSATPPGSATAPASTDTTGSAGPTTVQKPVLPDNTAVNERDRETSAKTPIDQKETQRDVNITAEIRKQVLDHKDMSVNARNVKIITADGKVTLRGPVNSKEERDVIDGIAKSVAGKENVEDQIEVAEKSK